jgi:hypothetical protein
MNSQSYRKSIKIKIKKRNKSIEEGLRITTVHFERVRKTQKVESPIGWDMGVSRESRRKLISASPFRLHPTLPEVP